MANKNAEDLIRAVRALPPSSPSVVGQFATKLFAVANDDGTVEDAQVFEIVSNWPGAGDACKDEFLRNNGIEKPVLSKVTFARVGTFVDQGEDGDWLFGPIGDNREIARAIFPNGQQFARNADASFKLEGDVRIRLMNATDNVLIDVEALNANTESTEIRVANDGAAWAIFRTKLVWNGDSRSNWAVAIKLS